MGPWAYGHRDADLLARLRTEPLPGRRHFEDRGRRCAESRAASARPRLSSAPHRSASGSGPAPSTRPRHHASRATSFGCRPAGRATVRAALPAWSALPATRSSRAACVATAVAALGARPVSAAAARCPRPPRSPCRSGDAARGADCGWSLKRARAQRLVTGRSAPRPPESRPPPRGSRPRRAAPARYSTRARAPPSPRRSPRRDRPRASAGTMRQPSTGSPRTAAHAGAAALPRDSLQRDVTAERGDEPLRKVNGLLGPPVTPSEWKAMRARPALDSTRAAELLERVG